MTKTSRNVAEQTKSSQSKKKRKKKKVHSRNPYSCTEVNINKKFVTHHQDTSLNNMSVVQITDGEMSH